MKMNSWSFSFFFFSVTALPWAWPLTWSCTSLVALAAKTLIETPLFFLGSGTGNWDPVGWRVWGKYWRGKSWRRKSSNSVYESTQVPGSPLSCPYIAQTKRIRKDFENWAETWIITHRRLRQNLWSEPNWSKLKQKINQHYNYLIWGKGKRIWKWWKESSQQRTRNHKKNKMEILKLRSKTSEMFNKIFFTGWPQ